MKDLVNSQQNLETHIQTHNIKAFLVLAMERTGTDELNIDKVSKDVKTAFPNLKDDDFKIALRNGGLGKYGRTYKLTTQEVCIWIRNYINEQPNPFKNQVF